MAGKNDTKENVLVGASLAALAAGAYFFLGPDGKKHQKQMKGWMVKMKGEVLEKIEETRKITEPIYNDIVDTVARTNQVAGKIPKRDIVLLAEELKREWKNIARAFKGKKPVKKGRTNVRKSRRTSRKTNNSNTQNG